MPVQEAGAPNPAGAVLICAWCQRAARGWAEPPSRGRRWQQVSPAFVNAVQRAGLASHGMCDACRSAVAREWGIPAPLNAKTGGQARAPRATPTTPTTPRTTGRAA